MKRGQIEIIGLMMVVILIMIIILTALWFLVKPKADLLTPQRQGIEVKSILLTLMKTTDVNDPKMDFKDKIKECVSAGDCDKPDGVQEQIKEILSLVFINKEYVLTIQKEAGPPIISIISAPTNGRSILKPCSAENNVINPGTINVDVSPGSKINAKLILCSKTI